MGKFYENIQDEFLRLRKKAISKKEIDGTSSMFESETDDQKLIEELSIYHAELEIQNEELQRTQKEAEKLANKYRRLYENAPMGYFTLSDTGRIIEVNLPGARMVGLERAYVKGLPFLSFVHRDSHFEFHTFLKRTLEGKAHGTCELVLKPPSAGPIIVHLKGNVQTEENEATIFCAVIDVSEIRRMEMQLNQNRRTIQEFEEKAKWQKQIADNERKLRDMSESLTGVVFRCSFDQAGNREIVYLSPLTQSLWGVDEEEIKKNPSILNDMLLPMDRDHWISKIKMSESAGVAWYVQGRFRLKSGEIKWIEGRGKPVLDDEKGLIYNGIFHDISEQKNLEMILSDEFSLAKRMQIASLSKEVQEEKFEVSTLFSPASHIAGDLYRWFKIDDHKIGILIIDVMGHGIPSALVNMWLHALIKELILRNSSPLRVMESLNNRIHELFLEDNYELQHYATAFYGVINLEKGEMEYVNAGHPPVLLMNKEGKITELAATAVPLGLFSDQDMSTKKISQIEASRLFLYTDGLFDFLEELSNSEGKQHLLTMLDMKRNQPSKKIIDDMNDLINQGAFLQKDDICLMIVDLKE